MALEHHTIDNPKTASWSLEISNVDYERMRIGFWTKEDFYILDVTSARDNKKAVIEKITWENKPGFEEGESTARDEAVGLSRGLLYCGLDEYPGGWRPSK
ncbi:Hypothetical protein D9617_7g029110 [Elsinoe fawcettii]|nr:Hypothetical protein D9617_7g029110 [Elsinoe fawcettii]